MEYHHFKCTTSPITVVSGPEIMSKYVGSSEERLREIFDKPPDIYDFVREQETDHGDAISNAVRFNVLPSRSWLETRLRTQHFYFLLFSGATCNQ